MKPHPKANPPQIARCPHCGNMVQHQLTHREDYSDVMDTTKEGHPIWDDKWWAILKCTTCGKLSLYQDYWDDEQNLWSGTLAYPVPLFAPKEVPENIRIAFDEAVSVIHRAPNLAAVGIRRCLEAMLKDQNTKGRTLADRIRDLGSRRNVPETLINMMDTSRLITNIGAHYSEISLTMSEVFILIEFIRAFFEYTYVTPSRIESIRIGLIKRGLIQNNDSKNRGSN